MSGNYRVEISSTGRAGCQSTDCKKAGTKIEKGALRLGTWVIIEDRGSWRWRHWGCITGKVLENIRNGIEDPANPGHYRWDYLDGYEGEDKHGLEGNPELQEKVRRVITQGFIDAEDWKGDPEMNQLGKTGMHTKENVKKAKDEQKANELQEQLDALKGELKASGAGSPKISELETRIKDIEDKLDRLPNPTPKKESATKKRKAAASDVDDDNNVEEPKPAPKKRVKKNKKEQNLDEDDDVKPAPKKSRTKKVVKKEHEEDEDEEESEPKPAPQDKKSRAKKVVKKEGEDHEEVETKPAPQAKKPKGKIIKKEEDNEMNGEGDVKPVPTKKGHAKKVAVKKEENEDGEEIAPKKQAVPRGKTAAVKKEETEGAVSAPPQPAPKKRGKTSKKETVAGSVPGMTDDSSFEDTKNVPAEDFLLEVESPEVKSKKKGKAKNSAARAVASTRASRSRKASGI